METTVRSDNSLLDLTKIWQWLQYQLIESGGELTPELEAFYNELPKSISNKVDQYEYLMTRFENEAELMRVEAHKYTEAARIYEANLKRMSDLIKLCIQQSGNETLQGENVRFQLSNAKPSLVVDEKELPKKYLTQVVTFIVDKDRVRAELTEGQEIPGAKLLPGKTLRRYRGKK